MKGYLLELLRHFDVLLFHGLLEKSKSNANEKQWQHPEPVLLSRIFASNNVEYGSEVESPE